MMKNETDPKVQIRNAGPFQLSLPFLRPCARPDTAEQSMKALSVRQPFAWTISRRIQKIENRTWTTSWRGLVAIHASRRYFAADFDDERLAGYKLNSDDGGMRMGAIVGVANLAEIVTHSDSPWFGGPFGWVFSWARPIQHVPCAGRLGLWDLPPEIEREVRQRAGMPA